MHKDLQTPQNVIILCNGNSSKVTDRIDLIAYLHTVGIQPYIAGSFDGVINPYYKEDNALFAPIIASRNNTNPLVEIKSIFSVAKQVRKHRINAALVYGVKNHGAMTIGARLGGVKNIICVVNGSGNLFRVSGFKGDVLRIISFPVLRIAYFISKAVCFQNKDDKALFLQKKLVSSKTNVFITGGSGVNLNSFPQRELVKENRFLFLARITPSKGINEYIDAARIVKQHYSDATFDIVGPLDQAIEQEETKGILDLAVKEQIVQYHGQTLDVPGWMAKCRFFVYPSYYPEGVPRCAMQAIATGRPVITCNTPGCKEIVVDGENGFLIPPKDPQILAEKMIWMIEHPEEVEIMSTVSRRYAEKKFDVSIINNILIDKLIH